MMKNMYFHFVSSLSIRHLIDDRMILLTSFYYL